MAWSQTWWYMPIILATWEADIGKTTVQSHSEPKKLKFSRPPSWPIAGYEGTHLSSQLHLGILNKRIPVQTDPGIKVDPISKITTVKRSGSMAQAIVKYEPCVQTPVPPKNIYIPITPMLIHKDRPHLKCFTVLLVGWQQNLSFYFLLNRYLGWVWISSLALPGNIFTWPLCTLGESFLHVAINKRNAGAHT
jgi:hypothetical protein